MVFLLDVNMKDQARVIVITENYKRSKANLSPISILLVAILLKSWKLLPKEDF